MRTLTRRGFCGACLLPAAAAALPRLAFPKRPRERLAVASYPFRAFIDTPGNRARDASQPGLALTDFPRMVRDRFDVRGIEPLGAHFPSTDADYLARLRGAVEAAGSRVVNIPVSVGASLYDPDAGARATAVANAKKWVDAAVRLGAPSIRVHIQRAGGSAPDAALAAAGLKSIAAYGESQGIVINLENDDLVSEDAFFIVQVIETAASPDLRALPDFGNSMLKGDPDFGYRALTAMFRHAYNIAHVKDSEVEGGKVFRVDMRRAFSIARANGYRGYFSMEWGGRGEPYEGTRRLIEESLAHL